MFSFEYEEFENRLRKMYKHHAKWARKKEVSCFRVYDADVPSFPLVVDVYNDAVYVAEYIKSDDAYDEQLYRTWRAGIKEIIVQIAGVQHENIFFKQRKAQKGMSQYEKLQSRKNERTVTENGWQFIVNLTDYLDTGLFLDHRNTRAMAQEWAEGKDTLNLFAYTGAFSVYMAGGGAASTTTVDLSNTYMEWTQRNMVLNGFEGEQHQYVVADCLKWLQEQPDRQYDLVILDPPTFSNSKKMAGILDIQRDHVWLIRETLRLIRPGGTLIFSTNFRKFKMDTANILKADVKDISGQTIPPDFRNQKIHKCFKIDKHM